MRTFEIRYNDGVYAATIQFDEKYWDNKSIEKHLTEEIKEFNTNINSLYHITRKNIKELTNK